MGYAQSVIEGSGLAWENLWLRIDDEDLKGQVERSRREQERLDKELRSLRRKFHRLRASAKKTTAANKALQKRPALHDPLYGPLQGLPPEIQLAIRDQALRVDRPVDSQDLVPFIDLRPPPVAGNLYLPLEIRPRYFQQFLRNNVVTVESLRIHSAVLERYEELTGYPVDLKDSIRALRWRLYTTGLFSRNPANKIYALSMQDIIRQCPETEHLTIEIDIRPSNVYNPAGQRRDPKQARVLGYYDCLRGLNKLKTVDIVALTESWSKTYREGQFEHAVALLKGVVVEFGRAVKQASPTCRIKWDLGPVMGLSDE